MKTSVIITGKLVQDHEFIYPYYRIREDDISVDVAVDGGKEVLGQIGSRITPTIDFESMIERKFDLIVLPGGAKCMEYLRQDRRVIQYIKDQYNGGAVIACICHAIQLLISAKIISGKTVSGYYSLVDDIENAGAKYLDKPVVVDGTIVTTAHYKDMAPWMKSAIQMTLNK